MGGHFLQLIVLIVLARLLDPRAFGLVGIAMVSLYTLERFTRPGFNQAIIQKEIDNVDPYLNTTWTVQLLRGVVLAMLLYVGAPMIASFFNEPAVIQLLRVLAIVPILRGVTNPGIIYFQKDLDFHKEFVLNMGSSIAQFLVSIGIAIVEPSVWALVFGQLAGSVTKMGASFYIHEYRPWPIFDLDIARELFVFGKWIAGSSMISFIISNGDDLVIGRMLPTAALGFYQYGYQLGRYSTREFTSIIAEVMFPAYSKLQNDTDGLREAFYHTLRVSSLIVFPMAIGAIVIAPLFVRGFLGTQWLPIIPVFQLIAIYGLLSAAVARSDVLLKAIGRPDTRTKIRAAGLVAFAILVIPLTSRYGITGTAGAVVANYLFVQVPILIYLILRYLDTSLRRFTLTVGYPLAASLFMGIITFTVRERLVLESALLEFFLIVPLGVLLYLAAILSLNRMFDWELDETYKMVLSAVQ